MLNQCIKILIYFIEVPYEVVKHAYSKESM